MSARSGGTPILITPKLVKAVAESLSNGTSQNMTALKLGISPTTVHRIVKIHIKKLSN